MEISFLLATVHCLGRYKVEYNYYVFFFFAMWIKQDFSANLIHIAKKKKKVFSKSFSDNNIMKSYKLMTTINVIIFLSLLSERLRAMIPPIVSFSQNDTTNIKNFQKKLFIQIPSLDLHYLNFILTKFINKYKKY